MQQPGRGTTSPPECQAELCLKKEQKSQPREFLQILATWHENCYQTSFAKPRQPSGNKTHQCCQFKKYTSKHEDVCGLNFYHKNVTVVFAVIMCHLAPFSQGLGSACPAPSQTSLEKTGQGCFPMGEVAKKEPHI